MHRTTTLLLLGAALLVAPVSAQQREPGPVTGVLFGGAAWHSLTDWDEGLGPRLDAELMVERLGVSRTILVDDTIGGPAGSEIGTFVNDVEVRGPLLRGGFRYAVLSGEGLRVFAAANAGFGTMDVRFTSPGGGAFGVAPGIAFAAAIGIDRNRGRVPATAPSTRRPNTARSRGARVSSGASSSRTTRTCARSSSPATSSWAAPTSSRASDSIRNPTYCASAGSHRH
jgi:hypothetical protein